MVSKEHWKGGVQLRWTSSWINIRQVLLVTSSSELVWPHQVHYQVNKITSLCQQLISYGS